LPLRTGCGISVQLERRAKCHAAIGGADVIDVARVTARAVLGIDQVDHVVKCCRLTPALVPPIDTARAPGKHAGKVTGCSNARTGKAGASVGVRPSVPAVGGPVNVVDIIVRKPTPSFIHARDVDGPVTRHVTGDLYIANEGTGVAHIYRGVPRGAVISGKGSLESADANSEVVEGNVHPPVKRRRWIVIGPARLAVSIARSNVGNACADRPGGTTVSRLPGADALSAAASSQKNCK